MPMRSVVPSEHQQQLVEALVRSGRDQNASEVLRVGLHLIEVSSGAKTPSSARVFDRGTCD